MRICQRLLRVDVRDRHRTTLLDGTVRLDLGRRLRSPGGWRFHLHLAGF